MEETKAIDVVLDRLEITYNVTEEGMAALENKYSDVPDCTDKAGYELCRVGIGELKSVRTSVEKRRKELKDPALDYGRRVDSVAKDLTARLKALEEPLRDAKAKIDNAKQLEKERLEAEEAARVEQLRSRIEDLRNQAIVEFGTTADDIAENLELVKAVDVSEESFQELYSEASIVKDSTIAKLENTLAMARMAEKAAEQQRIEAARVAEEQRIEAERLQAERDAIAAKQAAENARMEAERAAAEKEIAAAKAEAKRLADKEREIESARLEAERATMAKEKAEADAERARLQAIEDEKAAELARRQAEEREKFEAERAAVEAEKRKIAEVKAAAEAAKLAEKERLANEKLQGERRNQAESAILEISGLDVDDSKHLLKAIIDGRIPHIKYVG